MCNSPSHCRISEQICSGVNRVLRGGGWKRAISFYSSAENRVKNPLGWGKPCFPKANYLHMTLDNYYEYTFPGLVFIYSLNSFIQFILSGYYFIGLMEWL